MKVRRQYKQEEEERTKALKKQEEKFPTKKNLTEKKESRQEECVFCLQEQPRDTLIQFDGCQCKGSCALYHKECLVTMLKKPLSQYHHKLTCTICKTAYNVDFQSSVTKTEALKEAILACKTSAWITLLTFVMIVSTIVCEIWFQPTASQLRYGLELACILSLILLQCTGICGIGLILSYYRFYRKHGQYYILGRKNTVAMSADDT